MSWLYEQRTGKLRDPTGDVIGIGYSGAGEGKNDPDMQILHNIGPIPRGRYTIGTPHDTVAHGPYAIPLTPDSDNLMYGRSAFLLHGDSIKSPGKASEGCIIMSRDVRNRVGSSMDKTLEVVSDWIAPDVGGEIST